MLTCSSCNLVTEEYIEGSCGDIFCKKCIYIENNSTAFCPLHRQKISIIIVNMEVTEESISTEGYVTDSSSDKFYRDKEFKNDLDGMTTPKESEEIEFEKDYCLAFQKQEDNYELVAIKQRLTRLENMLEDLGETVKNKFSERSSVDDPSEAVENDDDKLCECKFAPLGCAFQGNINDVVVHEQEYGLHQILLLNTILQQNRVLEDLRTDNRVLKNAFNHCSEVIELNKGSVYTDSRNITLSVMSDDKDVETENRVESPLEKFRDDNFYKLISFVESEDQRNYELNEFKERLEKLEVLKSTIENNNKIRSVNFESFREQLGKIESDVKDVNRKFDEYIEQFAQLEKAQALQKAILTEKWEEMNELEKCVDEIDSRADLITEKQHEHEDKFLSFTLSKVHVNEVLEKQADKIIDLEGRLTAKSEIVSNHSCVHIWKIENFSQKQDEVYSGENSYGYICSNPFYTHEYGYKMTLNIDPNGFGNGKGTHLSCFLHIMKGSMDAILKWPIEYTATFTLLDQLTGNTHHSSEMNVNGLKQGYEEALKKPSSEGNPGCGLHQFIALNRLKPFYLIEDTIFLMVKVQIKM